MGKGLLQDPQTRLQETLVVLQERYKLLQEEKQVKKGSQEATPQVQDGEDSPEIVQGDFIELQEPSPQPNLSSYYKFIYRGRVIPQKLAIPLFFELERERGRTHRWMQISKSKKVEDVGIMEEKVLEMGKELSEWRDGEYTMRTQLQA